jgi:peptide-methionine (S)-S-oxide reductase
MQAWSQQYKTAVYYHDEEQKRIAEESRNNLASTMKSDIVTRLLPLTAFYLAEDYHQKYRLRNHSALMEEFEIKYPRVEDLISSQSVARVNGYLGGNGTCDQLKSEIYGLGLSESGSKKLLKEVCRRDIEMFCPTKNCF